MATKIDNGALQIEILNFLDKNGKIEDSSNFKFEGKNVDQLVFLGALNSLTSKDMVIYKQIENEKWNVTDEGNEIVETGSHEAKVFNAIPEGEEGISIAELNAKVGPSAKIGQGKAFKNKWISKKGNCLVRNVASIKDKTQDDLKTIKETNNHPDANILKDLKKRKLIDRQKITSYSVEKGEKFSTTIVKQATDITYEMLQNGSWKDVSFKKYNFDAEGIQPKGGYLHPLMKVREEFRQIFFQMGFSEMPTNKFVESSFWNFDALFQPQQHPARDLQDTFFLKDPATTNDFPEDYLERVRNTHEHGGYGSIGYGYNWSREETQKLILRTHTTSVSSYMLYTLAQKMKELGKFEPAKYFSIDRVFRNETVDATHLAEFHQVEGFIADYDLNLGHLIGVLNDFFHRMGVDKIKFKPAYNPYTEPSMEIFSYHAGLNEWVEIGNSGMFRPEMLRPMGLPENVRVIAWGLSLERPTMIKYSIDNIRELLGHKCDINMIQNNPICRLEKKMGREL
jgi:phenylalanyl-tRNA synthetase alpha chain